MPSLFSDTLPNRRAGLGIEGNDTRIGLPANKNDQQVAFNNRGATGSKKVIRNLPFFGCIAFPDKLSCFKIEADQSSLSTKRITPCFRQKR